jgi:ferric-dicitrate binding protein FerR (iron transport regulator)
VSDEDLVGRLLRLSGQRPELPAAAAARMHTVVEAAWRQELAARQRRRALGWLAAAAVLAGGLLLPMAARQPRSAPPTLPPPSSAVDLPVATVEWVGEASPLRTGQRLHARTRIATAGARVALRLAAGASLRIDTGSAVRLLPGAAIDLERGAVYVDSGNAASQALQVHTPRGTLRDVGTQFEARLLGYALRVRVREGRVTWDGARGSANAGEELRITPRAAPLRRPISGHGPDWEWVALCAPRFQIEGRTLRPFLDWVAREQGWELRFEPGIERRARNTRLHGSIARLSPQAALATVLSTTSLGVRIEHGVLHVVDAESAGADPRVPAVEH